MKELNVAKNAVKIKIAQKIAAYANMSKKKQHKPRNVAKERVLGKIVKNKLARKINKNVLVSKIKQNNQKSRKIRLKSLKLKSQR